MTTWRYVIRRNASPNETIVAGIGSKMCAKHRLAEGTDCQARERHAELHRGDEPRRVGGDLEDEPRALVALVAELGDACPACRDEAVLGRHEERVQQQEAEDG